MADMKMWSFAAVSSAWASRRHWPQEGSDAGRWRRAEVEKGVFVALGLQEMGVIDRRRRHLGVGGD